MKTNNFTATSSTTTSTKNSFCGTTEKVTLPGEYIVSTLCSGAQKWFGTQNPFAAGEKTGYVVVSKGLLIHTLYNEGFYRVCNSPISSKTMSRGDVLQIPMDFMPTHLIETWRNYVTSTIAPDATVTMGQVISMLGSFFTQSVGCDTTKFTAGFGITGPVPTARDLTGSVLVYTLYRIGENCMRTNYNPDSSVSLSDAINMPVSFLTGELCKEWETIVRKTATGSQTISYNGLLSIWKEFARTVGTTSFAKMITSPLFKTVIDTSCNYGTGALPVTTGPQGNYQGRPSPVCGTTKAGTSSEAGYCCSNKTQNATRHS